MKLPEDCVSLQDVRAAIDEIDQEIVSLIARRRGYVHAAAPFKATAASVRDPARVTAMLQQRRHWAAELGLSPDLIEQVFRDLVAYFTDEEQQQWQRHEEARRSSS